MNYPTRMVLRTHTNLAPMKPTAPQVVAYLLPILLGILTTGTAFAADAKPPEGMTYQGYLTDSNGVPLGNSAPANYDVVFRIYNAKTGGEPIWSEVQTVTVDKGYFSALLGEGASYGSEPYTKEISTVFVGQDISDRFIGITVYGVSNGVDLEIVPRLRLVASPFSFTASQARSVIDGSGNKNLFKEVDNNNNASLKLGAGSDASLILHESGDANLSGKLTLDLPAAGVGVEFDEQGLSTKFGGSNGDRFSISTARSGFHFDKSIYIDGDLYTFDRDARLYPSNNTDNYLNINNEVDTIEAFTDKFYVRDEGASHLEINPSSTGLDFYTTAPRFFMDKRLIVNDSIRFADGAGGIGYPTGTFGSVQTVGSKAGWAGYNISGRYAYVSANNGQVGLWNDVDDQWVYQFRRDEGLLFFYQKLRVRQKGTQSTAKALRLENYMGVGWELGVHTDGDFIFGYQQGDGEGYKAYIQRSTGKWVEVSDSRLKKDVEGSEDVLSKVYQLNPVRYRFKEQEDNARKSYGFIAQDVQKLFPYLVSDKKDYLALDYGGFGVLSIKAIQELGREKDAQFASLEKRNEQLESRVQSLEYELSLLKAQLSKEQTIESRLAKLEEIINNIN